MRHRFRALGAHAEDGSILIIVLVFMVVFGLITAAAFTNAGANFKNTVGVRDNDKKVYSSDAGINWALQKIRTDNTLCPVVGTYTLPNPPVINGSTAPTVTCNVTNGSVTGVNGYAVVTTSTNAPALTTPGPSFAKTINGPVFASSIDNGVQDLHVTNGAVFEGGSCSDGKPAGLTIDPPFTYTCTSTTNPAAAIDHDLPTSGLATAAAKPPAGTDVLHGTVPCRIFTPGKYTSIVLAKDNYFVSGVYYFANVGTLDVRKLQIVGGQPSGADEQATALLTSCGSDADAPGAASGTGVKFILGGNSAINVRNPSGRLELFSRLGGAGNEGTQGISLQTVCGTPGVSYPGVACGSGAPGSFAPSTLTDAQAVLQEGIGNTPRLRIHGQVYAPNALVSFDATNTANAWLLGGAVVGKLALRQQASIDAVKVSIVPGIGQRTLTITSSVQILGERRIVSTANVTIKNDAARTVTIQSWRTSCQTPAGADCTNV